MKRTNIVIKNKNVIMVSPAYFQVSDHNSELRFIDDDPRKEAIEK